MLKIQLPKGEWHYDPSQPLGKAGGFGAVFLGESDDHGRVAVKKLHISAEQAGHRELKMANELLDRELNHVISILDAGIDPVSGEYYFVMPCAEYSLQQKIDRKGKLSDAECTEILGQIVAGLLEVPSIVHRDLKPANILFHDNKWKIADFGIARFVEESTSLDTLKEFLSPQYAAPEQWNQERATAKTDIYALGCIAYALLTGAPPYAGPNYKDQHLYAEPKALKCEPALQAWIFMMLRKLPETRPDTKRVKNRLDEIIDAWHRPSREVGYDALAIAGAKAAEGAMRYEVTANLAQQEKAKRERLAEHAAKSLKETIKVLFNIIGKYAPSAKMYDTPNPYVWLDSAMLKIELPEPNAKPLEPVFFEHSSWEVVLIAKITLEQMNPPYIWSANLIFGDANANDEFRWREVLFMNYAASVRRPRYEPFAVGIELYKDAGIALGGKGMGQLQLAAKPIPIDDEYEEAFCKRWSELLAKAALGQLSRPSQLPLV